MKSNRRFKVAMATVFSALFLAGGLIYASDPVTSTDGCRNQTKEHNDGHCEGDGVNYFCADRNWLQSKDCVKHSSSHQEPEDETEKGTSTGSGN